MVEYKVGTNFDFDLLDWIDLLNKTSNKSKVTEIYGSMACHSDYAARPKFRLSNIDDDYFKAYVDKAHEYGLTFNYTLNSIFPFGNKKELYGHREELKLITKNLISAGVDRITVASPIVLEILKDFTDKVSFEMSTIAHVDTVTQIKYLYEQYGVTKICSNLLKNRDFDFLESAAEYCNKNNIILELMANEFCGVGGEGYATHCVYRDSCYICHSTNETKEDADLLNGYPMEFCTVSRNRDPVNWLKMNFIRPEDISIYAKLGINHFKLTGRTGSTKYMVGVIAAYLNEKWNGNLLSLWKPLESIKDQKKEFEQPFYIDNSKLNGFIEHFVSNRRLCSNQVCGETCRYCNNFYNENLMGE